jgi:glycosyltransferase involved in cell wall biosynthesis
MRALLVDPSLFTAPYDAALTRGLLDAGVAPIWAVRPVREGDRFEIPAECVDAFFYRRIDRMTSLPRPLHALAKGIAHAVGLAELVVRVAMSAPDVVHFQWTVIPPLDALAILLIRRWCPVVLTVHDTVPFNGETPSLLQKLAFDLPIALSDRIVVHTRTGKAELERRGIDASKLAVIPHGPLRLREQATPRARDQSNSDRSTFVLFGELKNYKGIDILIEALGMLPAELIARAQFIVAGRPRMDMSAIVARISELGLNDVVALQSRRLSEQEMADLFARADCFLFPYRQIDASGVYFLVNSLSKWIIATRIGVFAEEIVDGAQGDLIPPNDPRALAGAIARAIAERPVPRARPVSRDWTGIGRATREIYRLAGLSRRPQGSSGEATRQGPFFGAVSTRPEAAEGRKCLACK